MVIPQADRAEIEKRKTIIVRILSRPTKRTEMDPEREIETAMKKVVKYAICYTRGVKYGSVEVKFDTQNLAAGYFMKILQTEGSMLSPTFIGKRIVRVRVGKIPLEMETEWIAVAVLYNTS